MWYSVFLPRPIQNLHFLQIYLQMDLNPIIQYALWVIHEKIAESWSYTKNL
jgi:hypothetical protein